MKEPPHNLLYDALPGAWAGWFVLLTILAVIVSAIAGNEQAMDLWKTTGYELAALYGVATGMTLTARRIKPILDAKAEIDTAKASNVRMQTAAGAAEGDE